MVFPCCSLSACRRRALVSFPPNSSFLRRREAEEWQMEAVSRSSPRRSRALVSSPKFLFPMRRPQLDRHPVNYQPVASVLGWCLFVAHLEWQTGCVQMLSSVSITNH
ncbi:unnamed protein product [Musa acuminata var. zebrina]